MTIRSLLLSKVDPAKRRYTAGYMTDGKESGAYVMNWQWYSPNGVTPKRLPNTDLTGSFSSINQSTNHAPYLSWHDTKVYSHNIEQSPSRRPFLRYYITPISLKVTEVMSVHLGSGTTEHGHSKSLEN